MDAATAQELIRQLHADRDRYLDSLTKTTELLTRALASSANVPETTLPRYAPLQLTADTLRHNNDSGYHGNSTINTHSVATGEDSSSSESGDSLYVDKPLQSETFDIDTLRDHLRKWRWNESGRKILHDILGNDGVLSRKDLFPTDLSSSDDRSHLSHSSIYEIGEDGLPIAKLSDKKAVSRSLDIWKRIRSVNAEQDLTDKSVGKIVIIREPSPLLFAAAHHVMNNHFDMDEIFDHLANHDPVMVRPHKPFNADHRRRRSFLVNMEYFTLVGEGCEPMPWQRFDNNLVASETHIPLSRCSAVVALSLEGEPIATIRSRNRRTNRKKNGKVYDPFSPWRVLQLQAYPDWESTIVDFEDNTRQRRHMVNGPEAFLTLVLQEYRDAIKRLTAVYRRIEDLVQVPADFIFNRMTRDRLLFEDDDFTYSRRYFWATQTLGIMVQDIRDMVEGYREAFHDGVWQGTDKTVWPGEDVTSARHANWRKRMALLRTDIEREILNLEMLERTNEKKIKFIHDLRDNLFSGTSVMESRRSIHTAEAAILQNNNIRILTLVTIFFLPLTFVTSVYGMTNMDPDEPFYHFGWTTAAICLPCYLIIFMLNTESGLAWWTKNLDKLFAASSRFMRWLFALFNYSPVWLQPKEKYEDTSPSSQWTPSRHRGSKTDILSTRATTNNSSVMLSPVLSKTMSLERGPVGEGRPQLTSPGSGSVRFDFSSARARREAAIGEEDAGSPTPVKSSSVSAESDDKGRRGSGRSRTFVEMFRRKKSEAEESEVDGGAEKV